MRALVRPALAVLLLVGVAAARRAGRDELSRPAEDVAALCAQDGCGGGGDPGKAPPTDVIVGVAPAAPAAVARVEAPAPIAPRPVGRAPRLLADAPKTSPPA